MTHIRDERTSRRRAGATLILAAATGGLLAAAMAGSPTARADDPYTDITTYVTSSIKLAEADYYNAGLDFSHAGLTDEGLVGLITGFDNLFVSPTDYTVLGLVAAGTDTNYSGDGTLFTTASDLFPLTAAEETTAASTYAATATSDFANATTALTDGAYFAATFYDLAGGYYDLLSGQADTLAGLFSLGI